MLLSLTAVWACLLTTVWAAPAEQTAPVADNHHKDAPEASVRNGTVRGIHSQAYNQDFFLGIPFAQPPLGQLRFANPVSLNKTFQGGVFDASKYSPECVGYGSDQWNYNISEDCLYLNVVRPAGHHKHEKLPIFLWIHGGGFVEGGAPDQRYNLSFIVQNSERIGQPMIGVSINYRLSAWGFLSSDELNGSGDTNMGLRDQRLAMQWVQENIAAFGGDPRKVTIAGESAGAAAVGFHLTAYGGRDDGLFRAAIMESGNPINYVSFNGTDFFQPKFDYLVKSVNCSGTEDTLVCLRNSDFTTLNAAINNTDLAMTATFKPIIDGDLIRKYSSKQLDAGEFIRVPIIDGTNSDEGTAFSPQGVNTTEDFLQFLTVNARPRTLPLDFAHKILEAYPDDPAQGVPVELPADYRPGAPYGAQWRRSSAYFGDAVFVAPRRRTVESWAAAGVPAYSYRFNALAAGVPQDVGVTHFSEVAFVFNNIEGIGYDPAAGATPPFQGRGPEYAELSRQMSLSWVSFVHDNDPNTWRRRHFSRDADNADSSTSDAKTRAGHWPVYTLDSPQNFVWDANRTSYAEPDTWRKAGIDLINNAAAGIYHR